MSNPHNVIAIDGPAASGKSSVSRELARKLGWKWVSTGAFYRGLAYVAMMEGVKANETARLVELAHSSVWSVRLDDDQTRVFYKNKDVTTEILSEENGTRASFVSQVPAVRAALLDNQRNSARGVPGLVAEGRDCGTVVFPQAVLKVYLTASQEERAARRAREHGLNVQETQNSQQKRDQQDTQRAAAPLTVASDARVLDTGGMDLSQVVEKIYSWASQAMAHPTSGRL